MEDQFKTSAIAFQSFEEFFTEYQNELDVATRNRVFNSARHIAESVRRINKSELGYLVKLKTLMNI